MYILESIQEICFAQMVKKADIKLPKMLSGFFKLLFYIVLQGLLEFIWTEGYSGGSSNPGLALAILVL